VIVVDTSVWIDHFRDYDDRPHVKHLRSLFGRHPLVVGDLVVAELLQGVPNEAVAATIERQLRAFELRTMLSVSMAVQAARNYRTLRSLGATIRKTIDVMIGTYCIENDFPLLHNDRDFFAMEKHLGLMNALSSR
jgi:predicted nucleic acid-binding protein